MTNATTFNPASSDILVSSENKKTETKANKNNTSTKQKTQAEPVEIYAQIPPLKVFIMVVLTMGLYGFFWFYRNWIIFSIRKNAPIRKILRSFFFPVFCLFLFKDMFKKWPDALSYAVTLIILPIAINLVIPNSGFTLLIIQAAAFFFIQLRLNTPLQEEQKTMPHYKIGIGSIIAALIGLTAWVLLIYYS